MNVFQQERRVPTKGGHLSVRDITDDVAEAVQHSGIEDGIACVYSPDTTCCVRVNEWESGLLEDFAALLSRLVPNTGVGSLLLGSAGESIPVHAGKLCLGTWQRILFLELAGEQERRWIVQVVGSEGA